MMRTLITRLVSGGAIVAAGCVGNTERLPEQEFLRVDSAGRVIATNALAGDELPAVLVVHSVPLLRIGVREGDEALLFDNVRGAVRFSDGLIAIANGTPPEIRIFSDAGIYLGKLGGRGSGPGEFTYLASLILGRGDTLLAVDVRDSRLLRFTVNGGYVGMRRLDRDSITPLLGGLQSGEGLREYFHDGSLVLSAREPGPADERATRPTGELYRPSTTVVWIASDYSRARVIGRFGEIQQMRVDVGGGRSDNIVPPSGRRRVSTMSSRGTRICLTDNEQPELHCVDSDAAHLVVRWTQADVPTERDTIEAWKERQRTWARERSRLTSPQDMERMLAAVIIPPTVPPVRTIIVDTGDRVLVNAPDLPSGRHGWTRYRAFSNSGELVGIADLPAIAVSELGDDYLLGVARDPDEVQFVELYRVRRPGSSAPR